MFLCRAGRLSALDQALRSPVSLLAQVSAHRLRGGAVQRLRALCASSGGVDPQTPAHLDTQQPVHNWDPWCGFLTTTDWAHLDRVATVALNLSERVHREGGGCDVIRRPSVDTNGRHNRGAEPAARVLFTVSGRRSPSTMTVQTRASSTSAATKKREPEEEEQAGGSRGDVETLKEASTTLSTEKGPGDTEPEGGKPSKTQQLKKVFKEYGAVGVSFHIGISLMSLGMFYLLISSGIDMAVILCKLGFSEAVVQSKMAAGTSTFVLAYAIHKLFAPVRISITLVSVPLIVRYFRKTGLFKPPTPAP